MEHELTTIVQEERCIHVAAILCILSQDHGSITNYIDTMRVIITGLNIRLPYR